MHYCHTSTVLTTFFWVRTIKKFVVFIFFTVYERYTLWKAQYKFITWIIFQLLFLPVKCRCISVWDSLQPLSLFNINWGCGLVQFPVGIHVNFPPIVNTVYVNTVFIMGFWLEVTLTLWTQMAEKMAWNLEGNYALKSLKLALPSTVNSRWAFIAASA